MKYFKKFNEHTNYISYINSSAKILPNISYCELENEVHFHKKPIDYSTKYLRTTALESGIISFNILNEMGTEYIASISYSTDNGENWVTTNNQNNKLDNLVITVNVNEGDSILWKGLSQQTGHDGKGSFFSSSAKFDVDGNVMSLCYGDNFVGETVIENQYQFSNLFNDWNLDERCLVVNAQNLILPVTLFECCYDSMFKNCEFLITVPELPATTLASHCYFAMFAGCTSLTTAPELPATTLADACYMSMFSDCESLTTAPELPATTLTDNCYCLMFYGCTSLTTAPELPATTLVYYCYDGMFSACSSLTYIKAMFTTIPNPSYTSYWVDAVASTGTFIKNSAATWNVTGNYGVPTGWTVETASE